MKVDLKFFKKNSLLINFFLPNSFQKFVLRAKEVMTYEPSVEQIIYFTVSLKSVN